MAGEQVGTTEGPAGASLAATANGHSLGRFALMSLAVPKPRAARVHQEQGVLAACTREAAVLFITSRVAVGDTMEEEQGVAVAAGVQAILQELFLSIDKVFMPAMEM